MVTREQMDVLKSRYVNARNDEERELVRKEISQLCDIDALVVASMATDQLQENIEEINAVIVRRQMENILPFMSLAYIAKRYFGKSRQWLYQRINGSSVNGKTARFTQEEIDILNEAFQDMGKMLMETRIIA